MSELGSKTVYAGIAQLVERQISNLNVVSSNLIARSKNNAALAQMVERLICNQDVGSSSLSSGTK